MPTPPNLSNLTVTDHAELRAKERLGLIGTAFSAWLQATSNGWELHDAAYFEAQDLRVGRSAWLYRCPFTASDSVCLAVSDDAALLTVMRYFDKDVTRLRERLQKAERSVLSLRGQLDKNKETISVFRSMCGHLGINVNAPAMSWTECAVIRLMKYGKFECVNDLMVRLNSPGSPKLCWALCTSRLRTSAFSIGLEKVGTVKETDEFLSSLGIPLTDYQEVHSATPTSIAGC